jgi:hypothetical protein
MKKKVIVGIILAPIILVALIIIQYLATNFLISSQPFSATKGLIKANPVNLLQIDSISKFRSCQGHDLSGYNSKGELESNRSMKHYLNPATEFRSTKGKVEVYAPFDGIITGNFSGFRSAEVYIKSHDTNWVVLFYHIELLKALDTGGTVTAGQLIGYADVSDQSNFDISMQRNQDNTIFDFITAKVIKFGYPPFFNQYETMFAFMTDEVLAEYRARGFDPDKLVHSKEYRDNKPCDFNNERLFHDDDWIFTADYKP